MDPDEIKALIEAFAASDLAETELTRGDWTLRLVRSPDWATLVHPADAMMAKYYTCMHFTKRCRAHARPRQYCQTAAARPRLTPRSLPVPRPSAAPGAC